MDAKRSMRRTLRRSAGVTLTETVVASALLVASIIPLLRTLTAAHVMDRAIQRKSWSLLLAQQELERIRARCRYRYDQSFRVSSSAVQDDFLCTVADDQHATLRTLTVSVGRDRNENGILDPGEIEVDLCTRIARR